MGNSDVVLIFQVGDGAGDLDDFEIAAGAQVEPFGCGEQEVLRCGIEWCKNVNIIAR